MKTFEKILVPIDFGLHSAEAMRRAVDVASHYGASLTLIYVYEPLDYALPEGYALYTPEQVGQLMDEFRERLRAAAREVESWGGASRVSHEVLTGPAASVSPFRAGGAKKKLWMMSPKPKPSGPASAEPSR